MKFWWMALGSALVLPLLSLLDQSSKASEHFRLTLKLVPLVLGAIILGRGVIRLYFSKIFDRSSEKSHLDSQQVRRLFVMGGGGFTMEPENLKLDRYLLSLSTSARPKICFIGTASGDSERYLDKFYAAYQTLPCEPSHLSLFKPHTREIESFILSQEIIHIGEGNARNLLALWKEWGLDEILYKAYCKGIVISGVSAGMICWFEEGLTNSCGEGFEVLKGLGWIKGSAVPHYDGVVNREPSYESLLKQEMILPGLALENGVGALYVNEVLHTLVSSRDSASGYSYLEKGVLQERKAKYL